MSAFRYFSRVSAGRIGRLASFQQKLQALRSAVKLPEKYRGGKLEKLSLYLKSLGEDYSAAIKDMVDDAKNRPKKAAVLISGLALLGYAVRTNPSEHAFKDEVAVASNDLLLLSDSIRNPKSDSHIRHLEWCISKKVLRTLNLIVATVVWEADYDNECDTFAAHCSYLQPQYTTFHERVLDVGIMGCWVNLRYKMRDFDVNDTEWEAKEQVLAT